MFESSSSSVFSSYAHIVGLVLMEESAVLLSAAPITVASKISCSSTSSDPLTVTIRIDDISQNYFFVYISV